MESAILSNMLNSMAIRDLRGLISGHRETLRRCPAGHPKRSEIMISLGTCLMIYYKQHGGIQNLEEAIYYQREALLLRPVGNPDRLDSLNNLAACLQFRYLQQGNSDDLEGAIQYNTEAVLLCPAGHPDRSSPLGNLGNCLQLRYERHGVVQDMETAIQYHREVLPLRPAGHPDRSGALNNIANSLKVRFLKQGSIQDLGEAIEHLTEALLLCPSGHPERSGSLTNLGNCLRIRFRERGGIQDLEEAIQYHREALQLRPAGNPEHSTSLTSLANCLSIHYEHKGDIQYLEEAIQCHREALLLYTTGHPDRPKALFNLGGCLHLHYERLGTIHNLEEAIYHQREAVLLRPVGHPDRADTTSILGIGYHNRFKQLGDLQDLKEAIQWFIETLKLRPEGHPGRAPSLNYFANALQTYHEQNLKGGVEMLQGAISCHREARRLYPVGHPGHAISSLYLGTCLEAHYEQQGQIQDLEEAIQLHRDTQLLWRAGHPHLSLSLNRLASCVYIRYQKQENIQDLKEAICSVKKAIEISDLDHPSLTFSWGFLASIYVEHGHRLSASYDVSSFPDLFEKASNHPTASLKARLGASLNWIKKQPGPPGLKGYQRYLELADQYLLIRSSIGSRHQLLSSIPPQTACDAAASAIEAGDIRRAVEFLEQGRTILWSQMGRYRTPLNALEEVNPGLAAEFTRLSQLLEVSATVPTSRVLPQQSMEDEASKYRKVAEAWSATVKQIRDISGFETFLQPPKYSTLQQSSQNGPVVVINISERHCDAIIIQMDGNPVLVPLPSIQLHDVYNNASKFYKAIRESNKNTQRQIYQILRDLWHDIVGPIVHKLQELNIPSGSRIWWCPTSWLSMLPLHAAGPHRQSKLNLPDIYTCSYTPTLSALVRSYQSSMSIGTTSSPCPSIPHMLVIAQPDTPGQIELPCVWEELGRIDETVPSVDILINESGTHHTVMASLRTHSWVHFACHGSQDLRDPFQSSFSLYDKPLTLLDIIQARLPDAQYAFLSACHSAAGDTKTPNETIHLAAALQFSGFRSVIGTMYAMADSDGPTVAKDVYQYMFHRVGKEGVGSSNTVDYRDAAKGLNIATKMLRRNGVPVQQWINFVHIGA